MNMDAPSKEILEHLYMVEQLPMHRIAKVLNMSIGKVHKFITAYGIQPRKDNFNFKGKKHTPEALEKMSRVQKAKSNALTRELSFF